MGSIDHPAAFQLTLRDECFIGNPVLRISRGALTRQAERFQNSFPGTVSYAVKANSHEEVIRTLSAAGIGCFDVASLEEMAMVRSVAADSILHYHNPVRSRDEVAQALHKFGCRRFSVDHIDELDKIDSMVVNRENIQIAVRFGVESSTHAVQDFSTKFGASEPTTIEILKKAARLGYKVGLTFHPGSQTTYPAPYVKHIHQAACIAHSAGCSIEFLNVGGGFPSRYAKSNTPPLDCYFEAIGRAAIDAFKGSRPPKLECEPGRALVAPAAVLQTCVKAVRRDRHELFLNDGIYGGLMEAGQFPEIFPEYSMPSKEGCDSDTFRVEWKAFGPTCDPLDVLPCALLLPADIKEGDLIEFQGMGAYCTATATRFNGYGDIKVIIAP